MTPAPQQKTQPLSLKDFFTKMQQGFSPVTRNLPNDAGSYQSPVVTPGPQPGDYGTADYVSPTVPIKSIFGENNAKTADLAYKGAPKGPMPSSGRTFSGGGSSGGAPATSPAPTDTAPALDYSKYINPATGVAYTPQEYADSVASRAGGGVIPNYAGDALSGAPKTADQLKNDARNLNNTRNDIAVGETDPTKVASESGIQYTPAELSAIEKARAGIFDPALNDVMNKLDAKTKADEALRLSKEKTKQDEINFQNDLKKIVFNTNENIRQWRATTGTKAKGGGSSGNFTKTQVNKGASNAGLDLATFNSLDGDIKNFFINTPKGVDPDTNKSVPLYNIFDSALKEVSNGTSSPEDISQEITDSNLPEAVKHYYIEKMPIAPAKKQGFFSQIWSAVTGN